MPRLRNATTGEVVATEVKVAQGWFERMLGLIARKHVDPAEGIWFDDCSVIHTIGMQTEIDVIFLDKDDRVIRTVCSVPQNKFALACRGARTVVELGNGALHCCDVLAGDRFVLEE